MPPSANAEMRANATTPLFAIGAFGAFTLFQFGMVAHWHRSKSPHARRSKILDAIGAAVTGCTLLILLISKFTEGAWLVLVAIPPILILFWRIRKYNTRVDREILDTGPLEVSCLDEPMIVLPLKRLDRVGRKALRLAMALASDIHVVQILDEGMQTDDLARAWPDLVEKPARSINRKPPVLVVRPSAYRQFFRPLLRYLQELAQTNPDRRIAVLVPELVERRWYHFFFRHRTTLLKGLLILRGGPQFVIITAPWYVDGAAKNTNSCK